MRDLICFFCKEPGATTTVDYQTATGRKYYPPMGSRNYDARYGYPCHAGCLAEKEARLAKRRKKPS